MKEKWKDLQLKPVSKHRDQENDGKGVVSRFAWKPPSPSEGFMIFCFSTRVHYGRVLFYQAKVWENIKDRKDATQQPLFRVDPLKNKQFDQN